MKIIRYLIQLLLLISFCSCALTENRSIASDGSEEFSSNRDPAIQEGLDEENGLKFYRGKSYQEINYQVGDILKFNSEASTN